MKAIQMKRYGGPEVLELVDLPIPIPTEKEVLIEIKAIGVNYADIARREGQYVIPTPLPFVPGAEVAGVVREIGDSVTYVKPGDRVVTLLSSIRATGYAEYTIADERSLISIPKDVNDQHAAAILLQGLTAYHILKTSGQLVKGETVLVHAGAGGVGSLAIQLAKIFGAGKVIATASTDEKRKLAKELGADETVDYTNKNWQKDVLELMNGKGVDVALEMVGGDIFHQTLEIMASFGRVVVYGLASGEEVRINPIQLMAKSQTVTGFFLPQVMKKSDLYIKSVKELMHYIEHGQMKLIIGGVYPLEEAAKVHKLLQGRKTKGKLILEVGLS